MGFHESGELSPLLLEVRDLDRLVTEHVYHPGDDVRADDAPAVRRDDSEQMARIDDYFG